MIYALLVGVNSYPDAPLNWCLKDIDDMYAFLKEATGLKRENAVILKDSQAVKGVILEELATVIKKLKAGDVLYFHWSGHGTQIPNRKDSWEADGMDEAICPYFVEYNPNLFITDNELFQEFSHKHPDAMIIFTPDSCHSGDIGRNIKKATGKTKFLKLPDWLLQFFGSQKAESKPDPEKLKAYSYSLRNVVVVSACNSNQTAQDGGGGIENGKFTNALLSSLKADPTQNFERLTLDLQKRCEFIQTPQLQCAAALRKKTFLNAKPIKSRKVKSKS